MIERTFFSVGQALFCREKVNGRTIIYDCGGQKEEIVKAAIDRAYPEKDQGKKEKIDALFISHYDKDHINGVFHLLNRCNVRHLFLPMVSETSRMLSLYGLPYSRMLKDFFSNPKMFIRQNYQGTYFHYVVQQSEERLQAIDPIIIDILDGTEDVYSTTYLRFKDNSDYPDWVYVPYNRKVMTQPEETQFLKKLELPSNATLDDILKKWRQKKLSLKKIIQELGIIDIKKINDYSMTLYSGSIHARNACLFLGDYNASDYIHELHRAYQPLWQNISVIQVPHHGSWPYYSCGLCQQNTEYVISNKYGPYRGRQVNPNQIIEHIKDRLGITCKTTFFGDVVLN